MNGQSELSSPSFGGVPMAFSILVIVFFILFLLILLTVQTVCYSILMFVFYLVYAGLRKKWRIFLPSMLYGFMVGYRGYVFDCVV